MASGSATVAVMSNDQKMLVTDWHGMSTMLSHWMHTHSAYSIVQHIRLPCRSCLDHAFLTI